MQVNIKDNESYQRAHKRATELSDLKSLVPLTTAEEHELDLLNVAILEYRKEELEDYESEQRFIKNYGIDM